MLSEKDPAIDLSPDQKWLASLHGKVRNHSDALRHGIRETLIILAVHGNRLLREHPGFDAEARVADLVKKLLSPLDRERILSCGPDLPDFAGSRTRGSPGHCLKMIFGNPKPSFGNSCDPRDIAFSTLPLGSRCCGRCKFLRGTPSALRAVVNLLAKLCEMHKDEAHNNWSPKSEETLGSLFRSWWPQTAASLDERVKALEGLCRRHPALGWSVCIDQLELLVSASANYRPRWRDDEASAAPQVTEAEQCQFVSEAINLVLDWQEYDENTLPDLVERLEQFDQKEQLKVWDLIDRWADSTPSEDAKAVLRQRINRWAQLRRRRGHSIAHPERERAASNRLLPRDKASRQARLFASYWVDLAPDSSEDGKFDREKQEKRLRDLRVKALHEIWEEHGFEGVSSLIEKNEKTSDLIGELMTELLLGRCEASKFVGSCLNATAACNSTAYKSCLAGFVRNADTDLLAALIDETERPGEADAFITLLLCMPFKATTWRRLDNKPSDFRDAYWKRVEPRTWRDSPGEEINESVERLLAVGRANAAFRAALVAWGQVRTSLLKSLFDALPAASSDEFLNDPMTDDYNISLAFDELDKRPGVTIEEKARLEYVYLTRLDRSEHGIPNIEKHIAASPEQYAMAIACVYKRADGGEDPPGLSSGDPEQQLGIARQAQRLLRQIRYIPGTDAKGDIDAEKLKAWLVEVRSWCARHDRTKIGDDMIGGFLARAPADEDGVWPCRPVCEALEWMASEEVADAFVVGARNRRGAHYRGSGGDQERDLTARYRAWAGELVYEYPYVGGLLERIAASYDHEAEWQDTESEIRQRLLL